MPGALENSGSESTPQDKIAPFQDPDATQTGNSPLIIPDGRESESVVGEDEKTIISQRPVAAPEEFYKSMPLAELAAMLEGKQLDHFAVEQMIGGGGMGAVFRGRDERLDRTVAIKVIPAAKRDAETLRRFRLEAQAAARLDHPNIARVYYVGEAEQWNYIVFEFIDGVNVRDLVGMEGPLSVDDAIFYTRQVAEALQHAHEREVVHRDIKPSNILVTAGGIAKVVDMGLARNTGMDQSTADATASGITLGTFDYISPEQARNPRDADVRSDLYSLGCSLFYMLTGTAPFPEGTALQKLLNHGSQPPPDPRGWREDVSDQLHAILMKLMAKQPAQRYQKPSELVNDLLLLAELEDLPRSKTPGTLMLTPSVAQRSLLETNLPWMVAFAFLLGSTLWLQNVQPISSGFNIPEPEIQPLVSGDGGSAPDSNPQQSNGLELPAPSDLPSGTSADEAPQETPLVPSQGAAADSTASSTNNLWTIAANMPSDVSAAQWLPNLDALLERTRGTSMVEAEVRGTIVVERPIDLRGRQLTLRGTGAVLEVGAGALADGDAVAAVDLRGGQLSASGVEFRLSPKFTYLSQPQGIFRLADTSALTLEGCRLTLMSSGALGADYQPIAAVIVEESKGVIGASSTRPTNLGTMTQLSISNCLVRGDGSLVGMWIDPSVENRLEIVVRNSLCALTRYALDLNLLEAEGLSVSRNIRTHCEQSTFVTGDGFARLDLARMDTTRVAPPLVTLTRSSFRCVYDSPNANRHFVLVENGASPGGAVPAMGANALRPFLLEGGDNAYSATMASFLSTVTPAGELRQSFRFSDVNQETWFHERANEYQIRWLDSQPLPAVLTQITEDDFQLQKGLFTPGFQAATRMPPL